MDSLTGIDTNMNLIAMWLHVYSLFDGSENRDWLCEASQGIGEREARGRVSGAGEAALSSPRGSQRRTYWVEAVQLRTSTPLGLKQTNCSWYHLPPVLRHAQSQGGT